MKHLPPVLLSTALLTGLLFAARGEQINLQPVADTSLFELNPTNNLGGYTDFPAGTTREGHRSRGLVKFDLTAIPTNATVTSAALTLQCTKTPSVSPAGSIFAVHRVLRPWGEGTNSAIVGAPAAPGDATWETRLYGSVLWTAAGGGAGTDYSTTFSATNFVNAVGPYSFASIGLVADVQDWVRTPSTNFGWMLLSQSEQISSTARRFASREGFDPPATLAVTYTISAGGAQSPKLSGVALVGNQFRFSFNAEASRSYAVEFRTSLSSGVWLLLTNIPVQPNSATILISDTVTNASRLYRVRTP